MIDPIQILIIVVVSSLTILLIVIGIHIIYILQEIRRSNQKVNIMLDDAISVSHTVAKGVNNVSDAASGLSGFLHIFRIFTQKKEVSRHAKQSE